MVRSIDNKFSCYPEHVKPVMQELRLLIFETAKTLKLGEVEESLKWGEPSYRVKGGSTIRIDWKPEQPTKYFMFFHCQSKLVDTFRELYSHTLEFERNRAIVFSLHDPLSCHSSKSLIVRHCIELAFSYHKVKHLPLLGA
ncbi:DUF1801 domain-containing protein [Flocculibacter collagenilyticus]|uniref:DUF1801 domain-containing protein n=1 Tax=Flocculibacter collagenilyticus TaxID=2744479 RepID=UPI0018F66103|nr:DUF1801 domain-containing protein [Flocculibacter collagenilyticus]